MTIPSPSAVDRHLLTMLRSDLMLSICHAGAYGILLGAWFVLFFLQPLKEEARIMHEQQLDPTQIIAIPYDLQRLCIYVLAIMISTVFIFIQSFRMHFLAKMLQTLHMSIGCTLLFLLCGASVSDHLPHTFLAALYVVTLSWFDPPIFFHTSSMDSIIGIHRSSVRTSLWDSLWKPSYWDSMLHLLRGPLIPGTASLELRQQCILSQTIVYACWMGTIPAQILFLYDRGYQVQRFPIPILLGCTIGWIIGLLYGTVRAGLYDDRPPE